MDFITFQERASSLEVCPWCSSKGLDHALRSYPINLKESITLCTNPQCLFPFVSRPVEDVLGELVPPKEQPGEKRKNGHVFQSEDAPSPPPLKRRRSHEDERAPDIADPPVTEATPLLSASASDASEGTAQRDSRETAGPRRAHPQEGLAPSRAARQGQGVREQIDPVLVPARSPSEPSAGETPSASARPLSSEGVLGALMVTAPVFTPDLASKVTDLTPTDILLRQAGALLREGLPTPRPDPDRCAEPVEKPAGNWLPLPPARERVAQEPWSLEGDSASVPTSGTTNQVEPEPEEPPPTPEPVVPRTAPVRVPPPPTETAARLVPLPEKLFWRNSDKLCWLDALLVALVNCKSLRDRGPADGDPRSPTWELIARYDEVCAKVRTHQQTGEDGVLRVPEGVLQNAFSDLHSIRMTVFKLLQPKLKCRLGQRETPVFALPVLVAGDPWAERLFEQSFHWQFECSSCQSVSKTRVAKPLPSFTGLLSDWHPERAAHLAPCNLCHGKDQKRTMVLGSVPPVFALHFVEGLPHADLQAYAFSRQGRRYAVSTVVQYDQTLKHFVTWTRTPNGMWREFDDLKHPACGVHAALPVPPQEMHIVFWEEDQSCPPPPTETPPQSHHKSGLAAPQDWWPSLPDDEGALSGALTLSMYGGSSQDIDTSVGSVALLDAFQGLSSSDFITLTLVEVKDDDPLPPPVAGALDPAPEPTTPADTCNLVSSSSPPPEAPVEVLSDPESDDNMSGDPTFVPGSGRAKGKRKRQTKRQTQARAKSTEGPKEKKPRAAPKGRAASKGPKEGAPAPVVPAAVAVETRPPPAPVPSQASPEKPAPQSALNFLLDRHLQTQAKTNPIRTPAPATRAPATPAPAAKPAPLPAWRGLAPQLATHKLMRESSDKPQRHAGTYEGFGVSAGRATPAPSPRSPPALPPPPPPPQARSYAALCPGATQLPVRAPLPPAGKHGRPVEATDTTDALRLKLLKKLKAKKKKLDALNRRLDAQGASRPDSTEQTSPQAVTSSTAASNGQSDFFPDWLSPASTVSNLSPDSSGLPEVRPDGREAVTPPLDILGLALQGIQPYKLTKSGENLLEELLGGTAPGQTDAQAEARDVGQSDAGGAQTCAPSTEFDTFDMADLLMFGV